MTREALRREKEYSTALHETTLGLIRRLEVTDLLEAIVARAGALVDCRHGFMYLLDEASDEMIVRVGVGEFRDCVGRRVRPGEGLAGTVWQTGRPLLVPDYRVWRGRIPDPRYDRVRAIVGLPLCSGSNVIGVLALAHLDPSRAFGEDEICLLNRFARLASVALENARLCQALQRELNERRKVEEELRQAERRYRTLFDHVPVGIYRTTPDGRILDANPALIQMFGYPDRESFLASRVEDFHVDPEDRKRGEEIMEREGVVRNFEVRCRRYDGTIIWVKDTARAVRDDSGRLIYYEGVTEDITERKRVEEQMKRATEAKRALALKVLEAQEQERLHIARELHDTLGQLLTALKMEGEWIVRHADDPREVQRLAEDLCTHLDEAMTLVKRISYGLRPSMLDDLGIGPALEALVTEMNRHSTIRCEAVIEEVSERIPPETAAALYRIAQEALTNVLRHSQARCARVSLAADGREIILKIEDDGRGIPKERLEDPASLGLASMRERAGLLGGKLVIASRVGRGTTVTARIPLDAHPSAT
jgi:PAS domain S-box-containing protein